MAAPVITPEDNREVWNDAHPIPAFEVPVGWYVNDPMTNHNRTELSLRSENWRYHIDLHAVPRLGDGDLGPYTAELKVQVGGDASFVTEPLHRLTGIEPGAIQDAVYLLVGKAVEHELEVTA